MPFSKILCFCLILWCIRYDSETVNANFIVSRVHFIVWCRLSKMSYNVERAHVAHLSSWAWGQPLDRSPAVAGTESDVFTFLSCHPLKQSVLVGGNPLTPLSSVWSVSLRYRGRENFHGVVAFCLEVTTQLSHLVEKEIIWKLADQSPAPLEMFQLERRELCWKLTQTKTSRNTRQASSFYN